MKILAICGSPRKGNTYSALKTIQDNFQDIEIEIIMLKDLNFELCRGCYTCVLRGEEKCPIKDDRDMLIEKIHGADGVIVASPVYSHMVPALMKNLFDRFGFYAHRPAFFEKYAMSIVTCSGYGGEHASQYMDKSLSIYGFHLAPSQELHFKPGRDAALEKRENTQKIVSGVNALMAKIQAGYKDKPKLGKLIPFGIFKAIAEAAKDTMPADYRYYKNKSDYYYDTDLPFLKKWIAKKVVKKEVDKILK
jgi:multimeric flavodoxin WrbA